MNLDIQTNTLLTMSIPQNVGKLNVKITSQPKNR